MTKNWVEEINEKTLLAYFSSELKDLKPSTKWSKFSMLKLMINKNHNISIGNHANLIAFLKRKGDGYKPKKSKGALRREEIVNIDMSDIEDRGETIAITIPNTKTNIARQFVITSGNLDGINCLEIFRKYSLLRPINMDLTRFFLTFRGGKCIKTAIGINNIGSCPKKIAQFLNLANPNLYTGHCFRRSSASILADSGVDITVLQRHGGWKSASVAEGYVESSLANKRRIAGNILGDANVNENNPGTSNNNSVVNQNNLCLNAASTSAARSNAAGSYVPFPAEEQQIPMQFNGLKGCTLNFYQM